MFAVLYQFDVKTGHESDFVEAWNALTHLIYTYEGSLGSRLHHEKEGRYIAYAQWPSHERWKESGDKLPPEAEKWKSAMKEACHHIETIHTLNVTSDLLRNHENA